MADRYADDIKRIVGFDKNQSTLAKAEERESIGSKRGVGRANHATGASSGTSSAIGESTPSSPSADDTNQKTESNQINNQPLFNFGSSDGIQSAEDIIDGNVAQSKIVTPQMSDEGLVYDSNGILNGITASDCDTGDDVQIRFKGKFVPPNSDWDDAETPPRLDDWENWEEGIHYYESQTDDYYETKELIEEPLELFLEEDGQDWTFQRWEEDGLSGGLQQWKAVFTNDSPPTSEEFTFGVSTQTCDSGVDDACPTEAETEDAWPDDGQYNLRLDENGQFVTSQYDNQAPAKYKNPVSKVDFCFGSGRNGSVEITKDGGVMIYETSSGAPTGIIRIYDTSGNMIAATDGTAGTIDAYRP